MRQHWSLHRARKPQVCDACGTTIPARAAPDYAEYWRAKGGERGAQMLRVTCCVCHFCLGLPTDGWEDAPDGRSLISAAIPAAGGCATHPKD